MSRAPAVAASILVWYASQAFGASSGCQNAAELVEQRLALPHGLLRSIGEVETGNRPFSVDSDGVGAHFESADDAVSFVRHAASARFVDVGCFQIDLAYHPNVFRTLQEAFDPVINATAAGQYLLSLRKGVSSWSEAVARYHSGQLDRGGAYASRVYALLDGTRFVEPTGADAIIAGVRIVVPDFHVRRGAAGPGWTAGLPIVVTP